MRNYLLCFSLSLVCILNFTHLRAIFYAKCKMKSAYACTFFVPSFQELEKNSLGGERKPKIWARFSTPSPPVNRAKEKHLSWKMWRERGAPERLLQTLLLFRHNSAVRETRARLCFNHEAEYSCVIVSAR